MMRSSGSSTFGERALLGMAGREWNVERNGLTGEVRRHPQQY